MGNFFYVLFIVCLSCLNRPYIWVSFSLHSICTGSGLRFPRGITVSFLFFLFFVDKLGLS